ncbi:MULTISPECIES: flagellar biosynthetic protein FliR [Nocardioides]|uniref:Flagellar biosynthetic protein FliR n=1 Tax=Nocardioides lianchengensis TaxID=1045774 RepID=A0A1G6U0B9_9ACTN|nr:flagellar biosynthetic protein FliR [Nocardioides lianchengensis]NYG11575.1 flagellar biosynthetic protein FliR [Nocardioides lianchengensis]SDD34763.1 flagellar biosynthetic protein FliR [Nocardioides lianchengensis]
MTVSVAGEPAIAFLLASLRIIAWVAVVPPFASRGIPAGAKVVLSLGLALTVAPAMAQTEIPVETFPLIVTALTQVLIGLAMGFLTMLLFTAIAAAGSMIDVFGGFALAQGFDPLSMNSSTIFGKFHQMLATMMLFASGGHLVVIGGLLTTFRLLPIGTSPDLDGGAALFTKAFEVFFVTAVQIAMPMIAVLFIADLGLALMTKVAPALNALNVMFPAKIGLTLLLVGLSFPVLPGVTDHLVDLALEAMAALAGTG